MQISRTRFRLLSLLCITGRFMLMFHYIAIATSDSLQSGENYVSSIQGAVLTKHNYASFVVQNMFACYYQCIGDRRCQSLNFYETTKICELNNRTRIVGHLHFQPRHVLPINLPVHSLMCLFMGLPYISTELAARCIVYSSTV